MKCPQCSYHKNAVLESRESHGNKRRRRECHACEHRWTTVEIESDEYFRLSKLANKAQQLQSILSKGLF